MTEAGGADYDGPAVLRIGDEDIAVTVRLGGRFEPIDGTYRWGGRIAPDARIATAVRNGTREALLRLRAGGAMSAVQLKDLDPWGGTTVRARGAAPWFPDAEEQG